MQDNEPCILHLYILDLSTNIFLQALRNLCENFQAITALAAHKSFPPASAGRRSFPRWVRTLGTPIYVQTKCGVQDSAEELRNVPRAHLATRQAQEVPVYCPGTRNMQ